MGEQTGHVAAAAARAPRRPLRSIRTFHEFVDVVPLLYAPPSEEVSDFLVGCIHPDVAAVPRWPRKERRAAAAIHVTTRCGR